MGRISEKGGTVIRVDLRYGQKSNYTKPVRVKKPVCLRLRPGFFPLISIGHGVVITFVAREKRSRSYLSGVFKFYIAKGCCLGTGSGQAAEPLPLRFPDILIYNSHTHLQHFAKNNLGITISYEGGK